MGAPARGPCKVGECIRRRTVRDLKRACGTMGDGRIVEMPTRIFLLSPARCDGERAKLIMNPRAEFPLARALRESGGVELGEVFSFQSGLYFRGKLAYARAFARAPEHHSGTLVITTERGLVPPSTPITRED